MRARLAILVAVALLLASCGTFTTPMPSTAPSPSPTPTAALTPSPTPTVAGHWEDTGAMELGRVAPHAVALGDGGVLVVGDESGACVKASSVYAETWSSGDGLAGAEQLEAPLADFAAVPLADGRVLVTGGVNAGKAPNTYPPVGSSSAATYIYDPRDEEPTWTRVASLGTARTDPAAAPLPDGRVLVAGGYYLDKTAGRPCPGSTIALAVFRQVPAPDTTRPEAILANGPPTIVAPALATAELYDPASDTWSATGPLHYARFGARAVTLADGRVLVAGSSPDTFPWGAYEITVAGRAGETAEVYDPRTGGFSLTADFPTIEWAPLPPGARAESSETWSIGSLVALNDGGALLVGRATYREVTEEDVAGEIHDYSETVVRTLRLDPGTGRWTEVDRSSTSTTGESALGHTNDGALVALLGDGRVLVAGGWDPRTSDLATDTAWLYDPGADTWTALPPMPVHRAGGAAVALGDGSVLLVGGQYERKDTYECEGPAGLASTVRFVPAR